MQQNPNGSPGLVYRHERGAHGSNIPAGPIGIRPLLQEMTPELTGHIRLLILVRGGESGHFLAVCGQERRRVTSVTQFTDITLHEVTRDSSNASTAIGRQLQRSWYRIY